MLDSNNNKVRSLPAIIIIVLILGVILYLVFSDTKNTYNYNNTNNEENNTNNNSNDNDNPNNNNENNSNNNNNNNSNNNNGNNSNNNGNNNNNPSPNTNVSVTSIILSPSSKEIKVGESYTISITINPSNATNKTVTLKTSDKNVATVDANGKVLGVKAGTATITAKSNNGVTATTKVKVVGKETTNNNYEIKYNKKTVTKIVGERPFKNPLTNTGSGTNITYSSSDPKVAKVDKDGTVKLVSVGTATITATIKNNNYKTTKASYKVVAKFNRIAYSEINKSGKWINSKEHIEYAAKSNNFDSVKVDVQPTKDGHLVLCHDAAFTLTCDIKKTKNLSGCKIAKYQKGNKYTVAIKDLTKDQIKKLKYTNGNTVAFLEDYVNIMKKYPSKLLYITVRKNITTNYPTSKYKTYLDYFLNSLDNETKKRTIINSTGSDQLKPIRDRDTNIMVAYVVSDSSGDIGTGHISVAEDKNCILALYVFRGGKTQLQAYNTFVKGNNKKLTDAALAKGIPVYTGIVSDRKYIGNKYLPARGVSGAHIITE